jgi:hypothetical protein
MEYVHFLNIEYLLLRVYDIFFSLPIISGTKSAFEAPSVTLLQGLGGILGTIALVGMVLTIILFVFLVWVRVRLVIVEHEGFEEKEEAATHAGEAPHPPEPQIKNQRWERVRALANSTSESDWRLSILEADIMLGDLLEGEGYRGEGIGERLRDANPLQFSTLDLAWQAHKVRNDIAHAGGEYHLSQREANATIDLYRRVFEEFTYI